MEKMMTQKAAKKLKELIKAQEAKYMESVRAVALYGADQDGWHGEAYAMHYAEQLGHQDELMRLKKIEKDYGIAGVQKGNKVGLGSIVKIELDGKVSLLEVDGYKYPSEIPVITPEAPIAKLIIGKKSGEQIKLNNKNGSILEVINE